MSPMINASSILVFLEEVLVMESDLSQKSFPDRILLWSCYLLREKLLLLLSWESYLVDRYLTFAYCSDSGQIGEDLLLFMNGTFLLWWAYGIISHGLWWLFHNCRLRVETEARGVSSLISKLINELMASQREICWHLLEAVIIVKL